MTDRFALKAEGVSAVVKAEGAELVSLKDAGGDELLWQAGPEWPRHAPVLFPVVGRLSGDTLRHDGQSYAMGQHGFARDRLFEAVEIGDDRLVMRLRDDAQSRAVYPFPFILDLIYAVAGASLSVTTRVTNPGETKLACGVGAHPGFRWPLANGVAKERHRIVFDTQETGSALGVEAGLLSAPKPLPFDGRVLPLSETLFERDALVMPNVASRSVSYDALTEAGDVLRSLAVSWEGFGDLGIWSKPGGAPFVCIEPWYSMASPVDFDGDIFDKPGILVLDAGDSRELTWRVAL
ncbi:Galactose mutarotase [Fulvimarina manganoxydans]|uniref:Galactose mutarotase n=1 Tax=Fulvimarina manganoxydans TaxID=937218 RepID=A0A1W1Z6U6_9HYPH|nr:aldose 1-epimerase family protein [Fulvimarina manganoxydans]SMC44096.1 Galactose mutarotase [Fulvimarina manganoxydans]